MFLIIYIGFNVAHRHKVENVVLLRNDNSH